MKKILRAVGIVGIVLSAFSACKKEDPAPTYDAAKQLELDEQKIKAYLADSIPAVRHESGVYYVISEPGAGEAAVGTSSVTVKYAGRVLSGAQFDNSASYTNVLRNLIAGWQIGVPLIKEGGKIRLIIPSGYGYGPYANGPIPANSVLDFNIELLDVKN